MMAKPTSPMSLTSTVSSVQSTIPQQILSSKGTEKTKQKLEKKARRPLKNQYEPPWFALVAAKELQLSKISSDYAHSSSTRETDGASASFRSTPGHLTLDDETNASSKRSAVWPEAIRSNEVTDFPKSRPQLAGLKKSSELLNRAMPKPRTAAGSDVDDLVESQAGQGNPSSWQHSETVVDFLRRLPVSDPATAEAGPWLWVHAQYVQRRWENQSVQSNVIAFEDAALPLLQAFEAQFTNIEAQNPGMPAGTITRKLGPYRETLEHEILQTARKYHVTSGKWMFFPGSEELSRTWRIIAEATARGVLGPTSKVGTWEPGNDKKGTLICVYTYDFFDLEDVKRVLLQLVELGLTHRDSKQIYYKCDAYTYMGLGSDNPYKIKASLYGSHEVLDGEVRVTEDGKVLHVKKRTSKSMFDFLKK